VVSYIQQKSILTRLESVLKLLHPTPLLVHMTG
jgi:hypothetical protein